MQCQFGVFTQFMMVTRIFDGEKCNEYKVCQRKTVKKGIKFRNYMRPELYFVFVSLWIFINAAIYKHLPTANA